MVYVKKLDLFVSSPKKTKYSEHSEINETSKMELFVEIVDDWKLLTIFAKFSILHVWLGSE